MALAKYIPGESHNLVTKGIPVFKSSAFNKVYSPMLFMDKKPILLGDINGPGGWNPKVSSNKWMAIFNDPSKPVTSLNLGSSMYGRQWTGSAFWSPNLANSMTVDSSSGLTVTKETVDGISGQAAIRIDRSSISTDYLNVFVCRIYSIAQTSGNLPRFDSGYEFCNFSNGTVFASEVDSGVWRNTHRTFSEMANLDNASLVAIQDVVTVKKSLASRLYVHITTMFEKPDSVSVLGIFGWYIVLEPTNSNTYPG